jgi:hypothetical protein
MAFAGCANVDFIFLVLLSSWSKFCSVVPSFTLWSSVFGVSQDGKMLSIIAIAANVTSQLVIVFQVFIRVSPII